MIIQFEIAGPCRVVPKLEWFQSMKRIIWLWFSIAVYPQCSINGLKSVFADAWRFNEFEIDEDLIDAICQREQQPRGKWYRIYDDGVLIRMPGCEYMPGCDIGITPEQASELCGELMRLRL